MMGERPANGNGKVRPSERSPLLDSPDPTSGDGDTAVSTTGSIGSWSVDSEQGVPEPRTGQEVPGGKHVFRIISVLLIGVFIAQADGTLLLATHALIASEFNDLQNSTWLITSFALGGAATQTLYGKLSDIYGRKHCVLFAYLVFMLGCGIVGISQTMWQAIVGRVISGIGYSGMTVLVSVVITDLLPIREVAQWRAFVNVVATLGRSLGGPLGGALADSIGWRWSFIGQVPVIGLAVILCSIYMPDGCVQDQTDTDPELERARESKFSRIDFRGAFVLALAILLFLLPLQLGGVLLSWTNPWIPGLFLASLGLLVVFVLVEKCAKEPILPLGIFRNRDAVLSFLILGLQLSAQVGMMYTVPIYFQVTADASNAVAGLHLAPAVVGNTVGGLLSGVLIKRSGRYKSLIISAIALGSITYLLLILRWHGNTSWWESLYIIPGGFATGVAQSALFIALQVVIDPAQMAPAVSFMYLNSAIWFLLSTAVTSAVIQGGLRGSLAKRLLLLGLDDAERNGIIEKIVSDVHFVRRTSGPVHKAIVSAYVDGLDWAHGVSLLCSLLGVAAAIPLGQKRLDS